MQGFSTHEPSWALSMIVRKVRISTHFLKSILRLPASANPPMATSRSRAPVWAFTTEKASPLCTSASDRVVPVECIMFSPWWRKSSLSAFPGFWSNKVDFQIVVQLILVFVPGFPKNRGILRIFNLRNPVFWLSKPGFSYSTAFYIEIILANQLRQKWLMAN